MDAMTYAEKLKHPKWQKRRLEILKRDGFECTNCGDEKTELHVHHSWYESGKAPWDYSDEALTTLCKHCHQYREALRIRLLRAVAGHQAIAGIAIGLAQYEADQDNGTESSIQQLDDYEEISGYALGAFRSLACRAADYLIRHRKDGETIRETARRLAAEPKPPDRGLDNANGSW